MSKVEVVNEKELSMNREKDLKDIARDVDANDSGYGGEGVGDTPHERGIPKRRFTNTMERKKRKQY